MTGFVATWISEENDLGGDASRQQVLLKGFAALLCTCSQSVLICPMLNGETISAPNSMWVSKTSGRVWDLMCL